MEQLCGGYDFKEATFWDVLNSAMTDLEGNFLDNLSIDEALWKAKAIQLTNAYALQTTGSNIIPVSYKVMQSYLYQVNGSQRAYYIRSLLSKALASLSLQKYSFLLRNLHSAVDGTEFSPRRSFYSNWRWFTRGGKRSRYTLPFYITGCVGVSAEKIGILRTEVHQ